MKEKRFNILVERCLEGALQISAKSKKEAKNMVAEMNINQLRNKAIWKDVTFEEYEIKKILESR